MRRVRELDGRTPVHVVMRVRDDVRSLRARATFLAILAAFAAAADRSGLRLIHYSVLGNHLHLIVEAADRDALSRAIQGLAIRLARAINRAQNRKGRVFADHYFGHPLRTPAEVRHAIHYVVENQRLHELRAGRPAAGGSGRLLVGRRRCAGLSTAHLAPAHRLAPRPRERAVGRSRAAVKNACLANMVLDVGATDF